MSTLPAVGRPPWPRMLEPHPALRFPKATRLISPPLTSLSRSSSTLGLEEEGALAAPLSRAGLARGRDDGAPRPAEHEERDRPGSGARVAVPKSMMEAKCGSDTMAKRVAAGGGDPGRRPRPSLNRASFGPSTRPTPLAAPDAPGGGSPVRIRRRPARQDCLLSPSILPQPQSAQE